jgi:hypothetical protein
MFLEGVRTRDKKDPKVELQIRAAEEKIYDRDLQEWKQNCTFISYGYLLADKDASMRPLVCQECFCMVSDKDMDRHRTRCKLTSDHKEPLKPTMPAHMRTGSDDMGPK